MGTASPIYLVCGFPRSGTSMLMRSLEAGGLPCVYDTAADAARNAACPIPGYVPNPYGFYEIDNLHNRDWTAFRGKAVKLIRDNLPLLPTGERYKAVYLRRDPAEILASFAALGHGRASIDGYAANVARDVAALRQRWGADVVTLDYAEIVADPARHLRQLTGWPIDVARAAATIEPSLYRHRRAA